MTQRKPAGPLSAILLLFLLCFLFRGMEYLLLRTDQTWVGEAFVHKLAGIAVLWAALGGLGWPWSRIGFGRGSALRGTALGLLLGGGVFLIAYGAELLTLAAQGRAPALDFYLSAYAVEGDRAMGGGLLLILVCVLGNLINVVMEEGVFRGLFLGLGRERFPLWGAVLLSSLLFGVWHIAQPMRSFLDGNMTLGAAALGALGYMATTFLGGVKFCMLTQLTGSLWTPMADHFVNNTVINMLHVVTASGADELQFIRITVAQTLSFLLVLALFLKRRAWERPTFRGWGEPAGRG